MKKYSSKMKIFLVLAICVAFSVPSVTSASELSNPLVEDMQLTKGNYTIPGGYARSIASLKLHANTARVEFVVDNGEGSRKNRVSSVKIDLLDETGKKRAVAISPAQFNQNVSNAVGTLYEDDIKGLTDLNLEIQVRGPKGGFIVLNVTEYYEEAAEACVELHWTEIGYPRCPRKRLMFLVHYDPVQELIDPSVDRGRPKGRPFSVVEKEGSSRSRLWRDCQLTAYSSQLTAHCCNPLPGDEMLGIITRGRGISDHTGFCPNKGGGAI